MFSRKLRIGVIKDDSVVKVYPSIARSPQATVRKLRAAGHEIVDYHRSRHSFIRSHNLVTLCTLVLLKYTYVYLPCHIATTPYRPS